MEETEAEDDFYDISQRLEDYYRRNFTEYFQFVEVKSSSSLPCFVCTSAYF